MGFFDRYAAHGFGSSSISHLSASQLASNKALLYDSFAYNNWSRLGFDDKMNCLQALEIDFANQQGRPPLPVYITTEDCFGKYSPNSNSIYVNENFLDHGNFDKTVDALHPVRQDANMQLFDTIAHEGYHGYQNYAMRHPEVHSDKHQLSEWAMNEGKYYSGEKSGDRYYIQPQERDAWAYGYEKTSEAFREIEARNGEEPGSHDYEKMASMCSYNEALIRAESNDPSVLSNMESEMRSVCDSKGIEYDYEDPNVTPTMVEDKANYSIVNEKDSLDENANLRDGIGVTNDENQQSSDMDADVDNYNEGKDSEETVAEDNTEQEEQEDLSEGPDEAPSEDNAEQEDQEDNLAEDPNETPSEDNTEQEEQEDDLSEGLDEAPTEDNTEQEEQANDLTESQDEAPTEDNSEQEEQTDDLTEGQDEAPTEENTEQEKQANDLTEGQDKAPTEENTEQEEQANDLTEGQDEAPSEDNSEQEGPVESPSEGESSDYSGGGETNDESQSYGY